MALCDICGKEGANKQTDIMGGFVHISCANENKKKFPLKTKNGSD